MQIDSGESGYCLTRLSISRDTPGKRKQDHQLPLIKYASPRDDELSPVTWTGLHMVYFTQEWTDQRVEAQWWQCQQKGYSNWKVTLLPGSLLHLCSVKNLLTAVCYTCVALKIFSLLLSSLLHFCSVKNLRNIENNCVLSREGMCRLVLYRVTCYVCFFRPTHPISASQGCNTHFSLKRPTRRNLLQK